jgi:DNA-binding MarR family transcriptional regulator
MDVAARDLALNLLDAATQVVDGTTELMRHRGYDDIRPAHGFAFVRISAGNATTLDVAEHLGVTKQAASQLVEQLVRRGYVVRTRDAADARRRPLALTAQGRECTKAADECLAEVVARWRGQLRPDEQRQLASLLRRIRSDGPIRPTW